MSLKLRIEPEAFQDIQDGIYWYNKQQSGLGKKFHAEVKNYFKLLQTNALFQIRYKNVRCIPLNKFPYMIHYTIDKKEQLVIIRAVFNTNVNPDKWRNR